MEQTSKIIDDLMEVESILKEENPLISLNRNYAMPKISSSEKRLAKDITLDTNLDRK